MDETVLHRPAGELARMVRSGEISARELVGASLARIDALDPVIGAFTHVAHERALADAAEIDAQLTRSSEGQRPFAGVPIAIKDNRPVAGMPLTFCSDLWEGVVADHDAAFVSRLKDAGFVIVGKTKLPEGGVPMDLSRGQAGIGWGRGSAGLAGSSP